MKIGLACDNYKFLKLVSILRKYNLAYESTQFTTDTKMVRFETDYKTGEKVAKELESHFNKKKSKFN